MSLTESIGYLIFDWPTRHASLADMHSQLTAAGQKLPAHFAQLADTQRNRQVLNHIIGIERWGQQRLKVALGEPFVHDEYNGYRPPRERTWADLQADFTATRKETAALVQTLQTQGIPPHTQIRHNQYGALTLVGWLRYLNIHANAESKKMR